MRTQAGQQLNAIAYEVLVMVGLKIACTMQNIKGTDCLPHEFVADVFALARRREVPKRDTKYTVNEFCNDFLPITTERVFVLKGRRDWFHDFKYNLLPQQLSAVDVAMQGVLDTKDYQTAIFW